MTAAPTVDFASFFGDYVDWAYRLAALLTQNRAAGEEIAQEAFISVHQRWDEIDHPVAYLRKTLVNRAGNWHRHRTVVDAKLPALAPEESAGLGADELSDVIAKLDFRQSSVIVLRYYGGWSEAEIASALGCRPGTVKSLASRALRNLRKELGQ